MSTLNFNAEAVEPSISFDAIPDGQYIAVISDSELKETRAGNGRYLQLEFVVTEGEYANRKLWAQLNMENPSQKAVQFGRANLASICRAVNVLHVEDSSELHNIPLQITVRCRKEADGTISNKVVAYAPVPNVSTEQIALPSSNTPPAPPWAR